MSNEFFIGRVQKRIHFSQWVGIIYNENKFCVQSCSASRPSNHVSRENFPEVTDVEFATWSDSGCDDVVVTTLCKPLCDYVGPVHDINSHSNGTNQSTKRYIIDLISSCFVDEDHSKGNVTTRITNGLNGF